MQQFIKCITLIICIFATQSIQTMQKQIPPALEAKFSQILKTLDEAEQLNDALKHEAQDVIQRLTPFGAHDEIQRIEKRLKQFRELAEQKQKYLRAEPLPELEYLPEESNLLSQQTKPYFGTQTQAMRKAFNFIQTHGNAAAQRIRRFITSPKTAGVATKLVGEGLLAYESFIIAEALREEDPEKSLIYRVIAIPGLFSVISILWIIEKTAKARLYQAILTGNLERVRYILATGLVSPHTIITANNIPLILAAQHGWTDIVQLLLDKGADVSIEDANGRTVEDYLHIQPTDSPAIRQRKLATLKVILNYNLQRTHQVQRQFKVQYEPVEIVAADALESLHEAMYGREGIGQVEDITTIINSYLTPSYVHPRENPRLTEIKIKKD